LHHRVTPVVLALCVGVSCTPEPSKVASPILFSPEGNRLNAYATVPPFEKQTVIQRRASDPTGWDINGQLCFSPDGSGLFVVGEDTGQPDPPPGWATFQLRGSRVGELSAVRTGRLVPTYQPTDRNPDNFGCGFLADGRVVTTVIGSLHTGPTDGQLILWFPPFQTEGPTPSCKIDVEIGMAGQIHVDREGRVYVASARGNPGVWRYSGEFPTSPDAAGGCGRIDAAGAPLVDAGRIHKEQLIDTSVEDAAGTMGLAVSPDGSLFTSRSLSGVIAQFDADGRFVRRIIEPPRGVSLASASGFPDGTPSGLALGSDGTLYYADLGLVAAPTPRPRLGFGSVRRIVAPGQPPAHPEVIDQSLDFPDVVSLLEP
jgi:WD40 repeat protein